MPYKKRKRSAGTSKTFRTGVNSSGYQTYKDPKTGKWQSVHKRVAEKKVGGKIFTGYEVHHIDGNKNNNRRSNLTIVSKAEHRRLHGRG